MSIEKDNLHLVSTSIVVVSNSLLTGVEHKITQIIRASDPEDIIIAVSSIKRKIQQLESTSSQAKHLLFSEIMLILSKNWLHFNRILIYIKTISTKPKP